MALASPSPAARWLTVASAPGIVELACLEGGEHPEVAHDSGTSIAELCAAHLRQSDPARRAERIREGAAGWAEFWRGRVDLDALA